MKTLLDRLDGLANNMGSAIYEDAETCGEAAAELRRLHEANQALLEALKTVMGDANHGQNMTWTQRCSQARAAIDKGEQA